MLLTDPLNVFTQTFHCAEKYLFACSEKEKHFLWTMNYLFYFEWWEKSADYMVVINFFVEINAHLIILIFFRNMPAEMQIMHFVNSYHRFLTHAFLYATHWSCCALFEARVLMWRRSFFVWCVMLLFFCDLMWWWVCSVHITHWRLQCWGNTEIETVIKTKRKKTGHRKGSKNKIFVCEMHVLHQCWTAFDGEWEERSSTGEPKN